LLPSLHPAEHDSTHPPDQWHLGCGHDYTSRDETIEREPLERLDTSETGDPFRDARHSAELVARTRRSIRVSLVPPACQGLPWPDLEDTAHAARMNVLHAFVPAHGRSDLRRQRLP